MRSIHIKGFARPNSGRPAKPYKASFDGEYPQTAEHDPPKKKKTLDIPSGIYAKIKISPPLTFSVIRVIESPESKPR
jgi:hypothetical protein